MHDSFADWYRTASFSPTLAELHARFAAVTAAAALVGAGAIDGFDLADALFGEDKRIGGIIWFIRGLKGSDPTILLDDNENALRVLAACTLAVLMTDASADHGRLATAILAGTLGGIRRPATPVPLVELAEHAVARLQVSNRRLDTSGLGERSFHANAFVLESAEADEVTNAELRTAMEQIGDALEQLNERVALADRHLALQREELNMLWWVLTGTAGPEQIPLATLHPGAAALAIGWELAGLTQFSPEPRAIVGLISRALDQIGCRGPYSLDEAVDGLPPSIAQTWGKLGQGTLAASPRLAVLLTAVVRASAAPGRWSGAFERETGLPAEIKLEPAALALQAFRERTLLEQQKA